MVSSSFLAELTQVQTDNSDWFKFCEAADSCSVHLFSQGTRHVAQTSFLPACAELPIQRTNVDRRTIEVFLDWIIWIIIASLTLRKFSDRRHKCLLQYYLIFKFFFSFYWFACHIGIKAWGTIPANALALSLVILIWPIGIAEMPIITWVSFLYFL